MPEAGPLVEVFIETEVLESQPERSPLSKPPLLISSVIAACDDAAANSNAPDATIDVVNFFNMLNSFNFYYHSYRSRGDFFF